MYKDYLKLLFETVEDTQFLYGKDFYSYEKGMEILVNIMKEIKKSQNHVFFIGNGGSSAIASHMTADFMKNAGIRTYSLYDNAVTTCMGNDYGYEYIFSRPLDFLAEEGDLLVAISSSGNSPSIVNAIEIAKQKKCRVITFSGFLKNNKIKQMGDVNVYVPISHYGIVESIHNMILQQIVDEIFKQDGVAL